MSVIATLTYSGIVDMTRYRYAAQDQCGDIYAYNSMPCIDDFDGVWCAHNGDRFLPKHCCYILCGEESNHPHMSLVDLHERRPVIAKGLLSGGEHRPEGPPDKTERLSHTVELMEGIGRYIMQDVDGIVWVTRRKPELTPGGYWDSDCADEPRYVMTGTGNLEPESSLIDLNDQEFIFEDGILRLKSKKPSSY